MKKGIILATLTTLTILMTTLMTGCKSSGSSKIPPDQFATAASSSEERIASIHHHFDQYLGEFESKMQNQSSPQVLVYSEKLGLSYDYPSGGKEMPFHPASIGKVFTATLISLLTERGQISFDDPITKYLSDTPLENLFVFEGKDYAEQVTVKDLLAHTAGIADFFEDPVIKGTPFIEHFIGKPDIFWTPDMLLDFSRYNQKAVGKPGDVFHYSDTGYILLGKIIENVTAKPYHANLHDEFFVPLGMNDSYLMFYSEPANQPKKTIRQIWWNDTEVSRFTSLSAGWAGGGIVSTPADLLKFHQALRNGELISPAALKKMETFDNEFMPGIDYGLGMMEINFGGFSPMLDCLPRVTGDIGIWSTHMFYDRTTDTYINLNFGSTSHMSTSFEVLIEIMNSIESLKH
jgi:D-alanyl-D-alanine carboxypeptidase